MSTDDLRGVRPQGMNLMALRLYLQLSDLYRFTQIEKQLIVCYTCLLEIGWDVAFNQDPGPIYRAKIRKNKIQVKKYMKCVGLR